MKTLFSLSVFFLSLATNAQPSYDSLYVNNLHAAFNSAGDMFYNPANFTRGLSFNNQPFVYGAAANLWIGGYDGNNELHISAQTYRQSGNDFWAGPLDTTSAFCDSSRNVFYNKVWNQNCNEISDYVEYLQSQSPAGYTIPLNIQTWPGNGNASFGEYHYLAPFYDADGDGYYNFTAGDYPIILGHQSLFYVYNDSLKSAPHDETNGRRMGVEIRTMPYAFNLGWSNAVSNTVFVHYTIINRTTGSYNSTRVGIWTDIDLLSPGADKYSGSDSILNCSYNYDSTFAFGTVFLNRPMAGCITYTNNFTAMGNPTTAAEYYQYMNQRWKDGSPLTLNGNGYGGTTTTSWMYSGDPTTASGWNGASSGADEKSVVATGSFTLWPGMVYEFDIAFVVAKDTTAPYGCVSALKQSIQEVKDFYANESQFCIPGTTGINNLNANGAGLQIFPNPTSTQLTIKTFSSQPQHYSIFDLTGKLLQSGNTSGKETIVDVQLLPAGMYFLRVGNESNIQTLKFIKAE